MFITCFKKLSKTFVAYFRRNWNWVVQITNPFWKHYFENAYSLEILSFLVYIFEKTFHCSERHLMKIRKTCLNSTRMLKASGSVSMNKINARWIFWVFKACRFFDEVCQVEILTETFYVSVFWSYIKITHDNMIFITWWIQSQSLI